MITVTCDWCGVEFEKTESDVKRINFCCREHCVKFHKKYPHEYLNKNSWSDNHRKLHELMFKHDYDDNKNI